MNEIIAFWNAVVYILFLTLLLIKYKKLTISIYVLALYATCAVFSYFFIQHPLFHLSLHAGSLTIIPYVYFFITFVLFFLPVMGFKEFDIQHIQEPPKSQFNLLLIFISVVSLITSLIYFPEAIQLLSNPAGLAANKLAKEAGEQIILIPSPFGGVVLFGKILSDISILLFFYLLTTNAYSLKTKVFLGGIILLTKPMLGITDGSRATLAFFIFSVFFSYQIFKRKYSHKLRKNVTIISSLVLGLLMVFIISLTINRFGDENAGVTYFMLKYFGESFSNFNILMFDQIDAYTYGAKNFSYFTNLFGWTELKDLNEIRSYAVEVTGIPNHLFYTFIGQIYIDFGPVITFLIALLSSFYFWRIFKVSETLQLSTIIAYYLYINLIVRGVFFFPYAAKNGNLSLLLAILIVLLVKYKFDFAPDDAESEKLRN